MLLVNNVAIGEGAHHDLIVVNGMPAVKIVYGQMQLVLTITDGTAEAVSKALYAALFNFGRMQADAQRLKAQQDKKEKKVGHEVQDEGSGESGGVEQLAAGESGGAVNGELGGNVEAGVTVPAAVQTGVADPGGG